MGWIYIVLRTYPFWAIPLALTFFTIFGAKTSQRKFSKKVRYFYFAFGGILITTSIAFFIFRGPMYAVPLLHELIYSKD